MTDTPTPPHIFANHVIKQMIEHSFGGDLVIDFEDYQAIRVAFRSCGGRWLEIGQGSQAHIKLLSDAITAWGQMPDRKTTKDRLI